MENYYEILGLTEEDKRLSSSEFEKVLKKKFRNLCLQYHPDKQVGKSEDEKKSAEEKFKEINEAYSVLSDPGKKAEYDMYGQVGGNVGGFGGFSTMDDLESFMNQHMGMHFGFNKTNRVVKGTDVRIKLECTVEDIYNGAKKKLKYNRMSVCPDCNGTGSADGKSGECPYCHGTGMETKVNNNGWMQSIMQTTCSHCGGSGKSIKSPCEKCNGSGLVSVPEEIEITIPKDIRNGFQLTIRGKGNMAPDHNAIAGDLYIVFSVKQGGMFGFTDNMYDLYCKTNVGILDCITGCEKTVRCIDGSSVTISVPAGSKDGSMIAVAGKGMPISDTECGNMYVFVEQRMPSSLNADEKKKIEELKTMKHFKKQ